ncbi:MAG: glycosyltransferase family 2 protein [Terracidiphilus sp.]
MKQFASISMMTPAREQAIPHICVCICTYKRPLPLRRLLTELSWQSSGGLFTFSIVVADNDATKSAEATVADCRVSSAVPIEYRCEPRQGIARARNKVVENAVGDYLAFIDDDEFPAPGWLIALFQACNEYKVDGVLGPVIRYFDEAPPTWLKKSRLFDRRVNPTGMRVGWREARTGNVLLRKEVIGDDSTPFRPEFRTGEDQDFFRRKIEEGRTFIWCAQAEAFEVLPPARWKRMYFVRKALLQGASTALRPNCGFVSIAKSAAAVPLYALILPFALLLGQHHFMTILFKLCSHAGKLLRRIGIDPIREQYVTE